MLPLAPLLETTVEGAPLWETRTSSPVVPVALQVRVVEQVLPNERVQGLGEALTEPSTTRTLAEQEAVPPAPVAVSL